MRSQDRMLGASRTSPLQQSNLARAIEPGIWRVSRRNENACGGHGAKRRSTCRKRADRADSPFGSGLSNSCIVGDEVRASSSAFWQIADAGFCNPPSSKAIRGAPNSLSSNYLLRHLKGADRMTAYSMVLQDLRADNPGRPDIGDNHDRRMHCPMLLCPRTNSPIEGCSALEEGTLAPP